MISLSGRSPSPGEKLVALDSLVEFTIIDDGTGIDISTLIVEIRGFRAMNGTTFEDGFDGALSLITSSGSNFAIAIDSDDDFSIGGVYNIKVQVQDLSGNYLNDTYSFKTIPAEPILVESFPISNSILKSPQVLSLEFVDIIEGIASSSINITINNFDYIKDGVIDPLYNGLLSEISIVGTTALVKIDPIAFLVDGLYTLTYSVADPLGNTLQSYFKFTVDLVIPDLPPSFSNTGFLGYFQGIERVSDLGTGDTVVIEWNKPIKKTYRNEVFVITYQSPLRLNVFDNPIYIASSTVDEAAVHGLTPGESLSFGARALEVGEGVFDLNGMDLVDEGFYRLPEAVTISSQVEIGDLIIPVSSVSGYPDAGLLIIGTEAIRYTSVDRTGNRFIIPTNGRGIINSTPSVYLVGDSITLFLGCTDDNTVIVMSTPTHRDGYSSGRELNLEGLTVTDYSDNDRVFHQGFDFCGWHDPRPDETLTGKDDCGTYQGGEFNGWRGLDVYDRMLNREEVLLGVTGEPVILLKRIWDGVVCSCMDSRRMSPKVKSCQECYGTGYVGGFTQFNNTRREDRRILISFDEATEDLLLGEKESLQQEFEPSAWTLPIPSIRDRDLILRFDFTNDVEFIYEVLNVGREKLFNRRFGRQRLSLKRLDKTDINYTFVFDFSNIPTT